MPTRRSFLQQTSLATAGLLIYTPEWFKKKNLIGIQLYTLRGEIFKDPKKPDPYTPIARVAEIGYTSVEVFGYGDGKFFGLSPKDFAELIKKNKLETPSGHYSVSNYLAKGDADELKRTVEDASHLSHEFFTIPFLVDNLRTSLDDYKKLAEKLNKAGELTKKARMKLAYHNHNFEFKDWGGGKTGFDVLLKETDPALVNFEMDIFWVTKAGVDPNQLIKSNPGRIKMWHVKDMDNTPEKSFTEVGSGIINYKEIFRNKKQSGMEYFFVEQDQVKIPVYDSISKSLKYIKDNRLG